jgi:hypothetical protein
VFRHYGIARLERVDKNVMAAGYMIQFPAIPLNKPD